MNLRILFLDDEPAVVAVFRWCLSSAGYQIFSAVNHLDALEILRTTPVDGVIYSMELFDFGGPGFFRAVLSDPKIQRVPIAILCHRSESDIAALFAKANLDFKECVAACLTRKFSGMSLQDFLNSCAHLRQLSAPDRGNRVKKNPRDASLESFVLIHLRLSGLDPEWPSFLAARCVLKGAPRNFPPAPQKLKSIKKYPPTTVLVEPERFMSAVRAYEKAFHRTAIISDGAAITDLEHLSDGCTVCFRATPS